MAECGEGVCVVPNTTEYGSRVHLFNSFGRITSLPSETRRVHYVFAAIVRVEKSAAYVLYRLFSAYSPRVNGQSRASIRFVTKRGSTPSGGLGKGVTSTECKESGIERSAEQPARKPSASGASARSVEVGGRGGLTGGRAPGSAGAERKSSRATAAFERKRPRRESVPSAGWREVAESCHATEGQSHG